jgi:pyruvate formate-lyase activating enzyme-like uncharacterized protein
MKIDEENSCPDNHSKGCQLCQQGQWLCIFLTYLCNGNCVFCPAPFKQEDRTISTFGDNLSQILEVIKSNHTFKGISFSGGDSFLVFDRLLHWLKTFNEHRPDIYYWVYTNGLEVKESQLKQLSEAGLQEIRFNIAGDRYQDPEILEMISSATQWIKNVAIEIPSIPEDYHQLTEVLPILNKMKVKFLNLHEYILLPEDPLFEQVTKGRFILNHISELSYDLRSLSNTEDIIRFCQQNSLNIKVNNCSLQKKDDQMRYRRLVMGNLLKRGYEFLNEDGLMETYLNYPGTISIAEFEEIIKGDSSLSHLERHMIHPHQIKERDVNKKHSLFKLTFLPPLSIDAPRVLINHYEIQELENEQ